MESTLSWLDSSESERRSVMALVAALNEPGAIDELGIGTVRDTFADRLFPGVNTIQTRARYFLFVPWILQMVEAGPAEGAWDRSRRLQLRLASALVDAHGASERGIIGRESGAALQRWPMDIYWLGLGLWGIRRHRGSMSAYFDGLRRPPALRRAAVALAEPVEGRRDESGERVWGNWASLPAPPSGFPDAASFVLTPQEGDFLRERVALARPRSYLAHILQTGGADGIASAEYPWDAPAEGTALPPLRCWLRDARLFSLVHRGAVLLYGLMLAEALDDEERAGTHSGRLTAWSESMEAAGVDLALWDRTSMWGRLAGENPRLHPSVRRFCDRWFELAAAREGSRVGDSHDARRLVRDRERALKGPRARLTHAEARDRRRGYPTTARLEFRWTQVRRISADILASLERG